MGYNWGGGQFFWRLLRHQFFSSGGGCMYYVGEQFERKHGTPTVPLRQPSPIQSPTRYVPKAPCPAQGPVWEPNLLRFLPPQLSSNFYCFDLDELISLAGGRWYFQPFPALRRLATKSLVPPSIVSQARRKYCSLYWRSAPLQKPIQNMSGRRDYLRFSGRCCHHFIIFFFPGPRICDQASS